MEIILLHGLPPKNRKGSLTQREGYWVVIAREVSEWLKPSFAFVKAVYNYYHSNLKNVRGRVLELLENKGKDSIMVRNMYCTFWLLLNQEVFIIVQHDNGLNSERPISGDYNVFRLIAYWIYFHGNLDMTIDEKINDEVVYNIIYSWHIVNKHTVSM